MSVCVCVRACDVKLRDVKPGVVSVCDVKLRDVNMYDVSVCV